MLKICKNRFLDALCKFVLFSAFLHVIAIVVFFIVKRDVIAFNYFHIISAHLVFPDLIKGWFAQVISLVIMIVLYVIIFSFYTDKEKS